MKDQGENDALRVKKLLEEEEQKILKKNRLNGVMNNKIGEMKKEVATRSGLLNEFYE